MKEKVSPLNSGFNRPAESVVMSITGVDEPVLWIVFLGICKGRGKTHVPNLLPWLAIQIVWLFSHSFRLEVYQPGPDPYGRAVCWLLLAASSFQGQIWAL